MIEEAATRAAIDSHLRVLAGAIGPRPPGSPANRRATDHLVRVLSAADLEVEAMPFTCRWWSPGPGSLRRGVSSWPVDPSPFSPSCHLAGTVTRRSGMEELAARPPPPRSVLVIEGDLTAEPLLPRSFPFLSLPHQQRLLDLLERADPAAVLAVAPEASRDPVFEDADLGFPSATIPSSLAAHLPDGAHVVVRLGGETRTGEGVNVAARTRGCGRRTVLSAHVDSKATTPGAIDNAGGVAVLLALARSGLEHLAPVELVFFNGEDHYAAPGEQAYLERADLSLVESCINLDGVGAIDRKTVVAALAAPPELQRRVERAVERRSGWAMGEPWYQSDHAIFAMRGIPSLALTSEGAEDLVGDVIHTPADTIELVSVETLVDVTAFLDEWLSETRSLGAAAARHA